MTEPAPQARVPVHLGARCYDVQIGPGLLAGLGDRVRAATGAPAGARVMLACDRGLPGPTVAAAGASLRAAGFDAATHPLTAAETDKTLAQAGTLLAAMAARRHERGDPLVALGGGLVGDLAGFAAAVYRRGVPLIQCPTTLLAMVDASVGGKTAVNLPVGVDDLHKNALGAFHQPRAVLIDTDTLGSLPDRFFRAGLAECVKHGMISADWDDPGLLGWMAAHADAILTRDPAALTALIARNVRIKAAVVEQDEREEHDSGGRALLNLGHTFAHAIETLPGLSPDGNPAHAPLQHGEAVALGLVAATTTAEAAGLAARGLAPATSALLASLGLPTTVTGMPPDEALLERMAHDKKVRGGKLRLILPSGPGRAAVITDPPRPAVIAGLRAVGAPSR
ncbi:MAG: 3-dehydroquinate synthase family protein [Phycisphaerales bacterium]